MRLGALFWFLLKIRLSIDILGTENCKVSFGLKYSKALPFSAVKKNINV